MTNYELSLSDVAESAMEELRVELKEEDIKEVMRIALHLLYTVVSKTSDGSELLIRRHGPSMECLKVEKE